MQNIISIRHETGGNKSESRHWHQRAGRGFCKLSMKVVCLFKEAIAWPMSMDARLADLSNAIVCNPESSEAETKCRDFQETCTVSHPKYISALDQ